MTGATKSGISWRASLDEALAEAEQGERPVPLNFFSPT